jgi:hypothetical protein
LKRNIRNLSYIGTDLDGIDKITNYLYLYYGNEMLNNKIGGIAMNNKLHGIVIAHCKAWGSKQWQLSISFELLDLLYRVAILFVLTIFLGTNGCKKLMSLKRQHQSNSWNKPTKPSALRLLLLCKRRQSKAVFLPHFLVKSLKFNTLCRRYSMSGIQRLFLRKLLHCFRVALLAFFIATSSLRAQAGWSGTLTIQPYPSPYLSDWQSNPTIVILIVNNPGATSQIKIFFTVTRRSSGAFVGSGESSPILIPSGQTVLNNTSMVSWSSLKYNKSLESQIVQTGILPEGDYKACVEVKDLSGNTLIAQLCGDFTIVYPDPPYLIAPANGDTVQTQYPVFQWMPCQVPAQYQLHYVLRIVEVLPGQIPEQALVANVPQYENSNILTTNFQYPIDALQLQAGKNYAWQVQALNQFGLPPATNQGRSQIWTFTYAPMTAARGIEKKGPRRITFTVGNTILDRAIENKDTSRTQSPILPTEEQPDQNNRPTSEQKSEPQSTLYSIRAISPTEERPAQNNRPTFEWKTEPAIEGITYTIEVREIEEGVAPDSGRIFFERSGIRENVFRYPPEVPPLDTAKVYVWKVSGIKNGTVIAVSQLVPIAWPWNRCWLFPNPATQNICLGTPYNLSAWAIMSGFGISGPYTWSLTDPNGPTQTGSLPPSSVATISVSPTMPATPGVYTYTLIIRRGWCTRTATFTVNVYPNLSAAVLDYPSGATITDLCWGDDATLNMDSVPPGCSVTWFYRDLPSSSWNLLGTGNPYNTNQIKPTCSPPSQVFVTREFKGVVSCTNLPTPWPANCPNEKIVSLKVWCPTQPGTISVSPGTQICSNNNYPVNVTLTVTNYLGNISGWTVNNSSIPNSAGQSTITYGITSAGNYNFCVQVQNGTCPQQSACINVQVEDPINAQITSNKSEVCWGDDAQLTLTHNGPAGSTVTWEYQINCAGPWTTTGNTGTVQNTNELFGPSYPSVNPPVTPPCVPDKICWQAIVASPTGICPPTTAGPLTINVIVPPTAPTISPPGPIVKCPGTSVTLTASTPSCGTPPFTYQWYLNGLPIATGQTIQATQPGNYFVVVYNKNNCDYAQSTNMVTVRDCSTKVVINGPCTCSSDTARAITLTAIPTTFVVPPGPPGNCGPPYTYLWSTGATTKSITIPCPQQTTTYWVEVTNAMGCKTRVYHTIKRCP